MMVEGTKSVGPSIRRGPEFCNPEDVATSTISSTSDTVRSTPSTTTMEPKSSLTTRQTFTYTTPIIPEYFSFLAPPRNHHITILISIVRLDDLEKRVEQLEQKSVHVAYRHLQEPFTISRDKIINSNQLVSERVSEIINLFQIAVYLSAMKSMRHDS